LGHQVGNNGRIDGGWGKKWLRVRRQESQDEIEYDERVIMNVKQVTVPTFAFANLFLLVYLIVADQLLHQPIVKATYLILYMSATFFITFFIVPAIVRKK
jgi:hypothetical protein